ASAAGPTVLLRASPADGFRRRTRRGRPRRRASALTTRRAALRQDRGRPATARAGLEDPGPSLDLLLEALAEELVGGAGQAVDHADGGSHRPGAPRRPVAVQPGPHHLPQSLREFGDAAKQPLDGFGTVGRDGAFEILFDQSGHLVAEALQSLLATRLAAEVE